VTVRSRANTGPTLFLAIRSIPGWLGSLAIGGGDGFTLLARPMGKVVDGRAAVAKPPKDWRYFHLTSTCQSTAL
jgi:hypothetical protein